MWEENTQSTPIQSSKSTMTYQSIGKAKKSEGIDLIWDYAQNHSARTWRLSITSYIEKLLFKVGHKLPVKKKFSPHRCRDITYGSRVQQAQEEDSSPVLDEIGVLQVQRILESYYTMPGKQITSY